MYKIRLQRDFFETCNKWVKWQGLSVDIKILSPGGGGRLAVFPGDIFMYKIMKKTVWHQTSMRFVWNLEQMDQVAFLVSIDIKILPSGGCLPLPWGYIQYQIMKKNCMKSDFKEICLEQMGKMMKPFCWHQNCIPWGLSAVPRGCIHVLSQKVCIKSHFKDNFLKLATNEWSNKTFLLTSKLCPMGTVWPCSVTIYCACINHEKNV